MTSSEQASGKRNTSSLLVNSHFCILETVNLLCFYLPPKVYFFSQKDWHTKGNVQTRSVLDITSVEVLKSSMRRGGKTQKGRMLVATHSLTKSCSDTTVESGAMEADELLFLDLQRKDCRTHTQWKNSTHNRNFLGAQETLVSISFYTYA